MTKKHNTDKQNPPPTLQWKKHTSCAPKRCCHEELLRPSCCANPQQLDPYKSLWRFIILSWNVPVRNCSCTRWDSATNKSDKQAAPAGWIAARGAAAGSVSWALLWLHTRKEQFWLLESVSKCSVYSWWHREPQWHWGESKPQGSRAQFVHLGHCFGDATSHSFVEMISGVLFGIASQEWKSKNIS